MRDTISGYQEVCVKSTKGKVYCLWIAHEAMLNYKITNPWRWNLIGIPIMMLSVCLLLWIHKFFLAILSWLPCGASDQFCENKLYNLPYQWFYLQTTERVLFQTIAEKKWHSVVKSRYELQGPRQSTCALFKMEFTGFALSVSLKSCSPCKAPTDWQRLHQDNKGLQLSR